MKKRRPCPFLTGTAIHSFAALVARRPAPARSLTFFPRRPPSAAFESGRTKGPKRASLCRTNFLFGLELVKFQGPLLRCTVTRTRLIHPAACLVVASKSPPSACSRRSAAPSLILVLQLPPHSLPNPNPPVLAQAYQSLRYRFGLVLLWLASTTHHHLQRVSHVHIYPEISGISLSALLL